MSINLKLTVEDIKAKLQGKTFTFLSPQGTRWFRNTSNYLLGSKTGLIVENDLKSQRTVVQTLMPGKMYMFVYDPKTKKKLKYYDIFPVIFAIKISKTRILGINLHYLEPAKRATFLQSLIKLSSSNHAKAAIQISYQLLKASKSLRFFRPCLKVYLYEQIQSSILNIPRTEWEIIPQLPLENFKKETQTYVWNESNKLI